MGLFGFFRKKTAPVKEGFREKRQVPRWRISTPAKIRLAGNDDYSESESKDVNFGGFCLVTPEKIPEECSGLELCFDGNFSFGIGITVSWYKEVDQKHIYGMKFTNLRDQDKEKIFQMMQERFSAHFRCNL